MRVTSRTKCRICSSSELEAVIDLGNQPLANGFLPPHKDVREEYIPLRMCLCKSCGLCQLSHVVDPETLFKEYVYFSACMPTARDHFRAYALEIAEDYLLPESLVVEIGSNDGIFLKEFKKIGFKVLGVDPAVNIAKEANQDGIQTVPDYFSESLAKTILDRYGQADAVIGNNVVAHIDDHHDLVRGVARLLAPRGVFVFEAPHLVDMFENGAFDSVYHEHLSYLSLKPLKQLLKLYGLEIFKVKRVKIQGVSLRVYAGWKNSYPIEKSVDECDAIEKHFNLHHLEAYRDLSKKIHAKKNALAEFILRAVSDGKRIAVYGAPARGNVLLNFLSLPRGTFEYATEELPSKIGLVTPGTHIPVVDIKDARRNPPDYYLVLAWNYRDAILNKEREFLQNGGTFIFPVGEPMIVTQ